MLFGLEGDNFGVAIAFCIASSSVSLKIVEIFASITLPSLYYLFANSIRKSNGLVLSRCK